MHTRALVGSKRGGCAVAHIALCLLRLPCHLLRFLRRVTPPLLPILSVTSVTGVTLTPPGITFTLGMTLTRSMTLTRGRVTLTLVRVTLIRVTSVIALIRVMNVPCLRQQADRNVRQTLQVGPDMHAVMHVAVRRHAVAEGAVRCAMHAGMHVAMHGVRVEFAVAVLCWGEARMGDLGGMDGGAQLVYHVRRHVAGLACQQLHHVAPVRLEVQLQLALHLHAGGGVSGCMCEYVRLHV